MNGFNYRKVFRHRLNDEQSRNLQKKKKKETRNNWLMNDVINSLLFLSSWNVSVYMLVTTNKSYDSKLVWLIFQNDKKNAL